MLENGVVQLDSAETAVVEVEFDKVIILLIGS